MKKVLFIILLLLSILNADTLKKSVNETDMLKNKIYIVKKGDVIQPLTKDTIFNVIAYKDKRIVTLLSGSGKLLIK